MHNAHHGVNQKCAKCISRAIWKGETKIIESQGESFEVSIGNFLVKLGADLGRITRYGLARAWGSMLRTIIASVLFAASIPVSAQAGLGSWTSEVEKDPFSGGQRVTVENMTSFRSGILIFCDTSEKGIQVRIIPGYAATEEIAGFTPQIEFAIDEVRLLGQQGKTGSVGDNLAVAEVSLSPENSKRFVEAFAKANKQIAIKDGISDRPHLLSSRGSTKSGGALVSCMEKQAP